MSDQEALNNVHETMALWKVRGGYSNGDGTQEQATEKMETDKKLDNVDTSEILFNTMRKCVPRLLWLLQSRFHDMEYR